MNIVSFHKRDLQLVIQYLSIATMTGSSEELWFFQCQPPLIILHWHYVLSLMTRTSSYRKIREKWCIYLHDNGFLNEVKTSILNWCTFAPWFIISTLLGSWLCLCEWFATEVLRMVSQNFWSLSCIATFLWY